MAHPYKHAESSASKFGGKPEDYQKIHNWFDATKAHIAGFQHRALRHHTEGIFLMESIFGVTITNSEGKPVPTRLIGEQHVREDLGWIPAVKDWLSNLPREGWMGQKAAVYQKESMKIEAREGQSPEEIAEQLKKTMQRHRSKAS